MYVFPPPLPTPLLAYTAPSSNPSPQQYTSYATQAGDWGHWVVRELGSGRYPACKAVHTNMCPGVPPQGASLTEKERKGLARAEWFIGKPLDEAHMGYAIEMRTRPHSIGVAFTGMLRFSIPRVVVVDS